jgi:hypothetical protein
MLQNPTMHPIISAFGPPGPHDLSRNQGIRSPRSLLPVPGPRFLDGTFENERPIVPSHPDWAAPDKSAQTIPVSGKQWKSGSDWRNPMAILTNQISPPKGAPKGTGRRPNISPEQTQWATGFFWP